MELVLGELKGVLSESVSKFLKENVRIEESNMKEIFGESMDKVLYHDEGFIKDMSNKMSDIIMPAYMKELRYLKKVVSGVDKMTLSMKELQERFAKELKQIVPNPENHDDTLKRVNDVVANFVNNATKIAEKEIGLREATAEDGKVEKMMEQEEPSKKPEVVTPGSVVNNFSKNILNIIKKTGGAHKVSGGSHVPLIAPEVNAYMEEKHPPIKIPKGTGYVDYDGPLSKQISDIMAQKIAEKRTSKKGGNKKTRKLR